MVYEAISYNDPRYIIEHFPLMKSECDIMQEASFSDVKNWISKTITKFGHLIRDLIRKAIAIIENSVLTKNSLYYKNKELIKENLEKGGSFYGYLFNIFQDGGGIDKLKAALSIPTSHHIERLTYSDDKEFLDYIRGLMVSNTNEPCTKDEFLVKAKLFIYGSDSEQTHFFSEIYGGIDQMIQRMVDKRENINKLNDLYKSFEKNNKSLINARSIFTDNEDTDGYNERLIGVMREYMDICYDYLQIIIFAIKDEYNQSYNLCGSVIQ